MDVMHSAFQAVCEPCMSTGLQERVIFKEHLEDIVLGVTYNG